MNKIEDQHFYSNYQLQSNTHYHKCIFEDCNLDILTPNIIVTDSSCIVNGKNSYFGKGTSVYGIKEWNTVKQT